MPHTAHRQSQTERRRGRRGSPGASPDCCTRASASWPWGSSSTSSGLATRVSKHQRCGWWARRLSLPAWRAVCCVSPFAYLRSLAADGGPITRRTEDCPDAGKGRRCRWRAAGRGRSEVRPSAPPRADWTRPPATCPACPAGKKTRGSGGTAPLLRPRTSPCHHPRCHRAQPSRERPRRLRRRSRARRSSRARPSRARCKAPYRAPPPAAPHRATSPSPAAPTENSSSARHNSAPNPQAINRRNTPFIRHRTIEPKSPHVIA